MSLSPAQISDIQARADCRALAAQFGAVLRPGASARFGGAQGVTGSCPMCVSSDPKRATRFEASRTQWACVVCAAGGDALSLVQKATGRSFVEAAAFLGGARHLSEAEQAALLAKRAADAARAKADGEAFRAREIAACRTIWRFAEHGDLAPVVDYLKGRGLDVPDPFFGRAAAVLPFYHGTETDDCGRARRRVIHRGPAMLAPLVSPALQFCGLHITWFDPARPGCKAEIVDPDTGALLPAKKMRGVAGAAHIRLAKCAAPTRLFMGEGIETVLSARMFLARAGLLRETDAFWSALSLGNLGGPALGTLYHPSKRHANEGRVSVGNDEPDFSKPAIPIPASVARLVLLGDGDSDAFTTRMTLARGRKRYAAPGRTVVGHFAEDGKDFNNMWREAAA